MAIYTKRVQTVLSEEEHARLTRLSADLGKPLSTLIREAIERVYFEEEDRERRRNALASLLSLEAPVADWEQMEEETIRGAIQ